MKHKEVEIFDISYEGAGVGKVDGKVIFVPKTLPNERVDVKIVKDTSSFLLGEVNSVVEKSQNRIKPICPYFDVCGGCNFQHCDWNYEQKLKKEILKEELSKAGFNGKIEFFDAKERFFYRNKIKLEVKYGTLGYFKEKSHEFFKITQCPIATKEINDTIKLVQNYLDNNSLERLKNVYIKQIEKNIAICFLFDKKAENVVKKLKKSLNFDTFEGFSVFLAVGEVLESDKTKVFCVRGNEKLKAKIDDLEVEYDVSAFNQVNDDVAKEMYDYVISQVDGKRVVNAYSGQGVLTYFISKKAKFVYGIEFQKSSHECAEKLKNMLTEYKIDNICGKVEDVLVQILARDKIDCIVLDPAREGCRKEVITSIINSKIEQIIYISCNFSTLTRDVKILKENYEFESVRIFDMFPCTANMETVVKLRRKADL